MNINLSIRLSHKQTLKKINLHKKECLVKNILINESEYYNHKKNTI